MARENSYAAIVLKKQPYGEGDELVTVYTRENGKMRGLAKSTKLSRSKLQYALQSLFLVRLRFTLGGLPKIIGADIDETFPKIREDYDRAAQALYATELVLKFTPDEEPNERLFLSFADFLRFLQQTVHASLAVGLAKFKLELLETLGFAVHYEPRSEVRAGFSNVRGGFVFGEDAPDFIEVSSGVVALFPQIRDTSWQQLPALLPVAEDMRALNDILAGFIRFQLERDVKSERFLKA